MHERALTDVPFSFFVSLLREISRIPARKPGHIDSTATTAVRVLQRWIVELRRRFSPLPSGTTGIVLRLLFPEDESKRKYDLQETRLARSIATVLGVNTKPGTRGHSLLCWSAPAAHSAGCLGDEVKLLVDEASLDTDGRVGQLSLAQVDELLEELAAISAFSARSIRDKFPKQDRRSRRDILASLYKGIPSDDAAFLTQIILKDLRPLLYPLPASTTTRALLAYKSNAVQPLTKQAAFYTWDSSGTMSRAYRARSCFVEAAAAFESISAQPSGRLLVSSPLFGSPIGIPKCVKGQGVKHALQQFCGGSCKGPAGRSQTIWAENKYDGERAQIHVRIGDDEDPHITIFSKSKRDSTWDRLGIHPLILEAIGLGSIEHKSSKRFKPNSLIGDIVLEAEMVAWSDSLDRIDEFWRVRSLIESTAKGVRGARYKHRNAKHDFLTPPGLGSSQISLESDASGNGARHLALVFFDILMIDSKSLLGTSYSKRRAILEDTVGPRTRRGHVMLAERVPITMSNGTVDDICAAKLDEIFAHAIANHEEGLVLKADEGTYNDVASPWVKLKRDYIPGHGDTVDLVLLGAGWDKDRARELRGNFFRMIALYASVQNGIVSPDTFTTFYVGAIANALSIPRPLFEVYFTVSYGLGREQLEELNYLIKASNPISYATDRLPNLLPYDLSLFSGLLPPLVLFQEPLLAELYGAGFTKADGGKYYELRFPRATKIFRRSERSWKEAVTLQDLQALARASIGHNSPGKEARDWATSLWGHMPSPSVQCPKRKRAAERIWAERLRLADGRNAAPGHSRRNSTSHLDENMESASPSRKRLKNETIRKGALGSVTNIAIVGSTTTASREHMAKSFIQRLGHPAVGADENFGAYPTPPASGLRAHIKPHMPDASAQLSLGDTPLPLCAQPASSPSSESAWSCVREFLRDSVVWIARSDARRRPTWCPPTRQLISPEQRVYAVQAFLEMCGWSAEQPQGIRRWRRGVILVDDAQDWTPTLASSLTGWRGRDLGGAYLRLPIWVIALHPLVDNSRLTLSAVSDRDWKKMALCTLE